MYTVTCDDVLIHDPYMENNEKLVGNGKVVKKINCADSFSFTLYYDDQNYPIIVPLNNKIKVYKDGTCIFSGRPISIESDFYNNRTILCESDLAYLNDTILRPYSYTGTVAGYLQMLIDQHNAQVGQDKQLTLGQVTVTDANGITRSTSDYKTTWSELLEKTVNSSLGGYLYMDPENGRVLNYLGDSPYASTQELKTGENIIDYSSVTDRNSYATALIPLGAVDDVTGERLTIKSVNNGLDYIVSSNIGAPGLVYKTMIWDDITVASTLLSKGSSALSNLRQSTYQNSITAIDLSMLDANLDDLGFFKYVTVNDPYHSVFGQYLITERTYNISAPEKDTITLNFD